MTNPTRILMVEDRRITRSTIKSILRGLNYEITEARSGEIALEELSHTDYQAIILDLQLPGIDGFETLRKAQEVLQTLPPVVVLTEHDDAKNAFKAGKIPIFEFVSKLNLNPEDFKKIIISAVNKEGKSNAVKVKRCFKHNQFGCNVSFTGIPRRSVFVGIPFRMNAVYNKGIRPVVESMKMNCFRADELPKSGDFTCNVCAMIQMSRVALFDISTLNANVMMELGFAFGLGKEVIILKNKKTELPVDLGAFNVLHYATISELRTKLKKYLKNS
jgi:CheY-like chemotaxis protein